MKIGKIMYGMAGAVLFIATLITGTYGLSFENRDIYKRALSLQKEADALGFKNFSLDDYKVRFFDGDADYVVTKNKIQREKPVFHTFVGTAYEVNGEYQVILPTVENFAKMFDLLGAAETISEGSMQFEQNVYGNDAHIATLWHEAFHAYQMTHYSENVTGLLQGKEFYEDMEKVIVEGVDSRKDMIQYFEEGAMLLYQAYVEPVYDLKTALIADYLSLEQQRQGVLDGDVLTAEAYYETIEGTACYMESCIISVLKGKKEMEKQYMEQFSYSKGAGKYYKTGLLKCYLLNQVSKGWNQSYQFDKSLNELLQQSIQ